MSGFLSNLISRSSGRVPTLQPRVSSLFEPQRGSGRQLPASSLPNHEEASSTVMGMAEEVSTASTVLLPHDENLATNMRPRNESSLKNPIEREDGVRNEAGEFAFPNEPQLVVEEERHSDAGKYHSSPISSLVDRFDRPHTRLPARPISVASQPPEPSQQSARAEAAHARRPASSQVSQAAARWPAIDGAPAEELSARFTAIPNERNVPTTVHAQAAEDTRAIRTRLDTGSREVMSGLRRPEPAPEPIVHVAIDRIEVRTIAPVASATQSGSSARRTMSLKEYLRRRSSGRGARENAS